MKHRLSCVGLAALALALGACDHAARRALTFEAPSQTIEGARAEITIHLTNIHPYPIIPLTLTVYARPDATAYLAERRTVAEVHYYKPLQATEVRHHQTLDRIEADHVFDAGQWRRVPDSRFLHPRILQPGQTISETVTFQAIASYQRLLTCTFQYLPLNAERARARLFVRTKPDSVPPDAERYTEVFTRLQPDQLSDPAPDPQRYLLYRPARIHDWPPATLTRDIPIAIRPQAFTYEQAARRARHGARASAYFTPAGAWAFEYADDGTWFVTQDGVTKLTGHYAGLIAHLQDRQATVLTLTAPRTPDDKLLQHFDQAGYTDPKAQGPNAVATIPAGKLLDILGQAEALGYLIQTTTWRAAE